MKDKDILKILKKEANLIMPKDFEPIKREVTNASKQKVNFVSESYSKHKKWVGVFATCMLIIVAVIGISLPFVLGNDRISNALFNHKQQEQQEQEKDDSTDTSDNDIDDIVSQ